MDENDGIARNRGKENSKSTSELVASLMPETNRHEPGGSDKFASTGPPWTILFKTLNGKVLEREMEKHMMAYASYQGIHQPKTERQPDFRGNYSTFFVRFNNLQDARDAKVNFHHSKREYAFNGQLYEIETISSYGIWHK